MPQMIGEDHRSKSFSRRKVSQDQKTKGFGPEKPRTLGTLRHRTFCSTGFWETVESVSFSDKGGCGGILQQCAVVNLVVSIDQSSANLWPSMEVNMPVSFRYTLNMFPPVLVLNGSNIFSRLRQMLITPALSSQDNDDPYSLRPYPDLTEISE